jgi:uncharacterized DUF497 family protein
MSEGTDYEFEWDDAKADSNLRKHGVAFLEAMSVLADPLARTRFDEDHSEQEERWVSLGCSAQQRLLVVVHTFTPTGANTALVRLISARPATPAERKQYEDG